MIDWKLKLAGWLHDPAEKALILMRTREGHELGTARILRERLGIPFDAFDKRADHLAAADRPDWPQPDDERYPAWANVRFTDDLELIHPLSGETIKLAPLAGDIGAAEIKAVSVDHFARLIQEDAKKTFLAFWRFGPELGRIATDIGTLWGILPADPRVPDHSIWGHMDTVSALHTALAEGDRPALLAMSFGPVQGFIAQARSTSDLWAGSHLLSSLVWEALRSLVNEMGPDAVLFPALRGVPAVDAWLLSEGGLPFRTLFQEIGAEFLRDTTDTNPLFAAALPNKFVCVVPAKRARALAEAAIAAARQRAMAIAETAAKRVFDETGPAMTGATRAQISAQLAEFPEAFWAAATWPLDLDEQGFPDMDALEESLGAFYPPETGHPGFFGDGLWKLLSEAEVVGQGKRRRYKKLSLANGWEFFVPKPGLFYPAVYELAERSLAAAKSARPFEPRCQEAHRCTQCGEREWLTEHRDHLRLNRTERKLVSVWNRLTHKRPAWAKDGEHLCAVCTAKRLWPSLFASEVGELVGAKIDRFVVSTHALAVSTSIEINLNAAQERIKAAAALSTLENTLKARDLEPVLEPVTLPKRLMPLLHGRPAMLMVAKRLPALLELVRNEDDADERLAGTDIRKSEIDRLVKDLFGKRPEAYYALIQMDGDRMGAWLAGNEDAYRLPYRQTWHSQVRNAVDNLAQGDRALEAYLDTRRPSSPGRHAAISRALNDFAIHLARHLVEDCVKGKLLYAGGDDVLALVAVDDLFDAMLLLRLAYSGLNVPESLGLGRHIAWLDDEGKRHGEGRLWLKDGFGFLDRRLMTLMGHKATASMGAVVAHHTAPLGMVLRQLREAENQAKHHQRKDASGQQIDRDAFCIRVLKRGGAEVSVTSPWWPLADHGAEGDPDWRPDVDASALRLVKRLRDELAALTTFSRGAIYRAQLWFEGLTDDESDARDRRWRDQVSGSLAYQFDRKKGRPQVARDIVDFVCDVMRPKRPLTALENFLVTAEFFARESRVKEAIEKGTVP